MNVSEAALQVGYDLARNEKERIEAKCRIADYILETSDDVKSRQVATDYLAQNRKPQDGNPSQV